MVNLIKKLTALAFQEEVYAWWCEMCDAYHGGYDTLYEADEDANEHNLEFHQEKSA